MKRKIRAGVALFCMLPLLLMAGACSKTDSDGREHGPRLEIVSIVTAEVAADGLTLIVDSCDGEPVAKVSESELEVKITVTATVQNPGPTCQDSLDITLDKALGDRTIIDLSSNSTIPALNS